MHLFAAFAERSRRSDGDALRLRERIRGGARGRGGCREEGGAPGLERPYRRPASTRLWPGRPRSDGPTRHGRGRACGGAASGPPRSRPRGGGARRANPSPRSPRRGEPDSLGSGVRRRRALQDPRRLLLLAFRVQLLPKLGLLDQVLLGRLLDLAGLLRTQPRLLTE